MTEQSPQTSRNTPRNNGVVVAACLTFVGAMVGASFAAVPLYDMFCRVTGYNGTTQRVEQMSQVVLDRKVTVGFDANVASGLPWDFKPVQRNIEVKIGETVQVEFTATNISNKPTKGQAIFNVTPMVAGAYFNKVQCFCFTETELKPGETMTMPVVFYIDPEIVNTPETKSIGTLTLSYTFYPHESGKPVALRTDEDKGSEQKL